MGAVAGLTAPESILEHCMFVHEIQKQELFEPRLLVKAPAMAKDPITPRWLEYRVFGTCETLSWLKHTECSNMYGYIAPGLKAFPQIGDPRSLMLAIKNSRKNSKSQNLVRFQP